MLTEAVQDGVQAMRDPVGGSVEFHFVPILKLISTLLIMGVFDDEDVTHILKMLEPTVFSGKKEEEPAEENGETKEQEVPQQAGGAGEQQQEAMEEEEEEEFEEEEFEDDGLGEEEEEDMEQEEVESTKALVPREEQKEETEGVSGEKGAQETEKEKHLETSGESEESLEEGLFQMKLPESVKLQVCSTVLACAAYEPLYCGFVMVELKWLVWFCVPQMCTLLQYFCDCELRHRVEAIIAFSDMFVSRIQSNQRQRYNELMLAFTMSAAETARKTREFRSPPQEQVNPHKCRAGPILSLLNTHFKTFNVWFCVGQHAYEFQELC